MPSSTITALFLAALLAGLVSVLADSCPDDIDPQLAANTPVCRNGVLQVTTGNQVNCVVGCSQVFPPYFPQCQMTTSGSCTTIPVTASDYTQRVYGGGAAATLLSLPFLKVPLPPSLAPLSRPRLELSLWVRLLRD